MSARWHWLEEGRSLTLCRHLPPQFDVAASTQLPQARPARLAHQIRQDVWRALAGLRGFSPVVRLDATETGWAVTAGGRIMGRAAPTVEASIETVLNNSANRARWVRHAKVTA